MRKLFNILTFLGIIAFCVRNPSPPTIPLDQYNSLMLSLIALCASGAMYFHAVEIMRRKKV